MKATDLINTQYGKKFVLESDYKEKDKIKSLPWDTTHRMWDKERKAWTVDASYENMEILREIGCEFDESVSSVYENKQDRRKKAFELSKAASLDVDIPGPTNMDYYPFQKAGVQYAINALKDYGGVMICDEMGLGKTIQAIGTVNSMDDINKVLVICPASVKLNWKGEFEDWLTKDLSIEVVQSPSSYNPSHKDEEINPFDDIIDSDILIINYDNIRKYQKELKAYGFDAVILDESHYIKNYKAQRTKAAKKLAKSVKYVINLTGTPIPNRPIELFSQVDIASDEFQFWNFVKTYCDAKKTRFGWDMKGASNLNELYERLRSTCMVRRLKKDVLDLPPKKRQIIELPSDGLESIIAQQHDIFNKHKSQLDRLRERVKSAETSNDSRDYFDAVDNLKDGMSAAFSDIANLRKMTADRKIPYIVDHIDDVLEKRDKVVVFAHHQVIVKKLKQEYGDEAVFIDGTCSDEEREEAKQRFQNDDQIKVFIGSIHAAGEGITLTAADWMIFAEIDWTPEIIKQCEDRIHRIGQDSDEVMYQFLVLEGSIDAYMIKQSIEKLKVIEQVLDDGDKVLDKKLEKKKAEVAKTVEENTKKSKAENKIEKVAKELTPEQIDDIHTKLKQLSEMCDGANSEDGQGFNKLDTGIGKQLARRDKLTKKQAALGLDIVKKYSRQVGEVVNT